MRAKLKAVKAGGRPSQRISLANACDRIGIESASSAAMERGAGHGPELNLPGLCLEWKLGYLNSPVFVRDRFTFPHLPVVFHRSVPL